MKKPIPTKITGVCHGQTGVLEFTRENERCKSCGCHWAECGGGPEYSFYMGDEPSEYFIDHAENPEDTTITFSNAEAIFHLGVCTDCASRTQMEQLVDKIKLEVIKISAKEADDLKEN